MHKVRGLSRILEEFHQDSRLPAQTTVDSLQLRWETDQSSRRNNRVNERLLSVSWIVSDFTIFLGQCLKSITSKDGRLSEQRRTTAMSSFSTTVLSRKRNHRSQPRGVRGVRRRRDSRQTQTDARQPRRDATRRDVGRPYAHGDLSHARVRRAYSKVRHDACCASSRAEGETTTRKKLRKMHATVVRASLNSRVLRVRVYPHRDSNDKQRILRVSSFLRT